MDQLDAMAVFARVVEAESFSGAARALEQVAVSFPNLSDRGKDRPTVDDVEMELWDVLSGHAPVGQAAAGLYKLDRIGEVLADSAVASAHVLMSVEKADPPSLVAATRMPPASSIA